MANDSELKETLGVLIIHHTAQRTSRIAFANIMFTFARTNVSTINHVSKPVATGESIDLGDSCQLQLVAHFGCIGGTPAGYNKVSNGVHIYLPVWIQHQANRTYAI